MPVLTMQYWDNLKLRHNPAVLKWLNRPRTVKFWLLVPAAMVVLFFGYAEIKNAVEFWYGPTRPCGPNCVEMAGPPGGGIPSVIAGVVLLALGAFLVWRAARAYRVDPREH